MNELIDKLISIKDIIHILKDDEKKIINDQVDLMNQMMDTILFKVDMEEHLQKQFAKDKIITNTLFPIYWYLHENLNLDPTNSMVQENLEL